MFGTEKKNSVYIAIDCFVFATGSSGFKPEGPFKITTLKQTTN